MMKRNGNLLITFGAVLLLLLSLSACLEKQEPAEMTALMAKAATPSKAASTPTPTASPTKKQQDSSSYEKKDSSSRPDNASPKKSDKKQKEEPASEEEKEPQKRMIAIDAGHQDKGNSKKEPIGPGAKTKKPKVTSGTQGVATKVPEYKLTLVIALKVKEELINRGYDVFMIRETHDVDISNKERADLANESGADLFIRIHADGSENSSVSGTSTLYPSKDNPYVSHLSEDSYALSKTIVDSMCKLTKAKNRGAIARDDLSGINWCTIPVSVIEMGYMSNKKEDTLMQKEEYQDKLVQGICNGIDAYYEGKNKD